MSDSHHTGHEPCPDCGSQDTLARYSDGHGHCFGCGRYEHGEDKDATVERRANEDLASGEYAAITKRGLKGETLRKFDYRLNAP